MNETKPLSVAQIESAIREFINHPRKISRLIQDEAKWNAICSALDAIGDAEEGLHDIATYEFADLRYAFDELNKFFTRDPSTKLTKKDAEFFILVVEQKILHLKSVAGEIDQEYESDI